MESAAVPVAVPVDRSAPGAKGVKADCLGYASNLVIAIASTAPAYSIAATLGFITLVPGIGIHAPAIMIVSFIPILFVSLGYRYFNLADPDCGTTFAWVTRAMGPQLGWLNGWAIFLADIIVMASLSDIASIYTFRFFGWTAAANSNLAQIIGCIVWISVMTWICYRGIELSARIQQLLLTFEIAILSVFAVVSIVRVYTDNHLAHSIHPALSWFNPFTLGFGPLASAVLLGIFIYWGWDSGVAVNEESQNREEGPGRAAVVSTLLLLLIYVVVSVGAQAIHGPGFLSHNDTDVLNPLGPAVFGGGTIGSILSRLLVFCVLTSASASTQTTILPTARTTLSMASWGAIPKVFGRIHPRFQTPTVSTLGMGALSIIWTVGLLAFDPGQSVLNDSVTALGFAVCFYYGFTGLACAIYYRKDLFKSARRVFFVGFLPLLGAVLMFWIFVKAYQTDSGAGYNYSAPLLGVQVPIVIGVGGLLVGIVLMLASWPFMREYFRRRPEVANPKILDDHFAHHHGTQ
jgi:amino acid transporter